MKKENINTKINAQIKVKLHHHPLIRLVTKRTGWFCDNCKNYNYREKKSYYCSLCDYDLCETCKRLQFNEPKIPSHIPKMKDERCRNQQEKILKLMSRILELIFIVIYILLIN